MRRVAALILLYILSGAAFAADTTIRLICDFDRTMSDEGTSPTSGSALITVTYAPDGSAVIRKEGLGATFAGKVSAEEIVGSTVYEMDAVDPSDAGRKVTVFEKLAINRFTGEFIFSYSVAEGGGLIHFGKCRAATKPLF